MFDVKEMLSAFVKDKKRLAGVLVLTVMFISAMIAVNIVSVKEITVKDVCLWADTETTAVYKTKQSKISEFFKENNIIVNEGDRVDMSENQALTDGCEIVLARGTKITIETAKESTDIFTTEPTVEAALLQAGIAVGELDEITPSRDSRIVPDSVINIAKIEVLEICENQEIPFKTVSQKDSSMTVGKMKTINEGVNGVKEVYYTVTLKDGYQIGKEYKGESVITEPVTKTVAVGTKAVAREYNISPVATQASSGTLLTSRGESYRYKAVYTMKATAYDTLPSSNGGSSRTATGIQLKPGVVAVDPRVIPLGSRVYVESVDGGGNWSYGYAIAGDTGGAIKGNRIDLCFSTTAEARRFGVRQATVYVLE